MVISKKKQKVFQVVLFRKNMGTFMPKEKLEYFWGKGLGEIGGIKDLKESDFRKRKIKVVEENINSVLFLNWVQFVGITGSVAADICQEGDDIDVFVVVKNDRMWIYRAILILRLGFKSLRRVWGKPFKDKIDTNFICEERGILFNTESIFVLHELLFMIPVYNKAYYEKILDVNYKLLDSYAIRRKQGKVNMERNYLLKILDKIAFLIQYAYMLLKRHSPDNERLQKNNKKGRIAFFPDDFRRKKIKEFERFCEQY